MKKLNLLAVLSLFLLCSCARFYTENKETTIGTDGLPITRVSSARITTFFDSKSALATFSHGQSNANQLTTVGSLSQESSSTNLSSLIGAVTSGAIEAALKYAAPKP